MQSGQDFRQNIANILTIIRCHQPSEISPSSTFLYGDVLAKKKKKKVLPQWGWGGLKIVFTPWVTISERIFTYRIVPVALKAMYERRGCLHIRV